MVDLDDRTPPHEKYFDRTNNSKSSPEDVNRRISTKFPARKAPFRPIVQRTCISGQGFTDQAMFFRFDAISLSNILLLIFQK